MKYSGRLFYKKKRFILAHGLEASASWLSGPTALGIWRGSMIYRELMEYQKQLPHLLGSKEGDLEYKGIPSIAQGPSTKH